jgi:hypothetical protein
MKFPEHPLGKRILKRKEFLESCQIIASNDEKIDIDNPRIKSDGEKIAFSWQILANDDSTNVEFHKLSVDFDGKSFIVYFDDINIRFLPLQMEGNENKSGIWPPTWWPKDWLTGKLGGFCWWNWSSWTTTSYDCGFNYWCFGKFQRATYANQTRYCISNTNNVQYRRCKVNCGC